MRELIIKSLVTFTCCVLAGIARYGMVVFNYRGHRFTLVQLGFTLTLFYFLLVIYGIKPATVWIVISYIAYTVFLRGGFGYAVLLWDAIYFSLIAYAVYMFAVIINKGFYKNKIYYYPVAGVFITIGTLIHHIIYIFLNGNISQYDIMTILINVVPEFLTGLGIGLGVYFTSRPLFNIIFGIKKKLFVEKVF